MKNANASDRPAKSPTREKPTRGLAAAAMPPSDKHPAPPSTQGVGLLVKAFQLLDLFTREQPSWSQAELQRATDLSRSTLGRLVRFLHARRYLAVTAQTGRYSLGFAAIDLGRRAERESSLVKVCTPVLQRIAGSTGETVLLTAYDAHQSRAICLEQIPGVQEGLKVFERIGAAFPLYRGASPKAILAFLPHAEIESVITVVRDEAPEIDVARLRRDLKTIRTTGLATSLEETYPGIAGFAVPVLAPSNTPLGSIAVAAPIVRMGPSAHAGIGKLLLEAGATVADSLRRAA